MCDFRYAGLCILNPRGQARRLLYEAAKTAHQDTWPAKGKLRAKSLASGKGIAAIGLAMDVVPDVHRANGRLGANGDLERRVPVILASSQGERLARAWRLPMASSPQMQGRARQARPTGAACFIAVIGGAAHNELLQKVLLFATSISRYAH
jgi:hypothetical protein